MTYLANTPLSLPDLRDIPYVPRRGLVLPKSFDRLPKVFEIDDQGSKVGSCVANGFSEMLEERLAAAGRGVSQSRMFLYAATLKYEDRLGKEGTYPRDALKVLHRFGSCAESAYPYDSELRATDPPPEIYALAAQTVVERYEAVIRPGGSGGLEIAYKVDLIKSALVEGMSVGFGMPVTESIRHLTGPWQTHNYIPEDASHPNIGGHFMVKQGWDDYVNMWLIQNSWSKDSGDGGFIGMPYSIVDHPFFEAWLIRSFDGSEMLEQPGVKLEWMQQYSIGARIAPVKSDLGKMAQVWIGAKFPDGRWFLKTGTGDDSWRAFDGVNFPPSQTVVLGDDSQPLVIAFFTDLTPFVGTEIYVAWGQTPLDATVEKLCTIKVD